MVLRLILSGLNYLVTWISMIRSHLVHQNMIYYQDTGVSLVGWIDTTRKYFRPVVV